MASIKAYAAKDGTQTWRVRYRLQGHSSSKTFADQKSANTFGEMVDRWGPERALAFIKEPTTPRVKTVTVAECVERYAALRTGSTCRLYRKMARLYITPALGDTPIGSLTTEMVQLWVYALNVATGTIGLAHTILSGALVSAVARGEIPANPAAKASKTNPTGVRLPRSRPVVSPVFLSDEEYKSVINAIPEHYKLLVEFLYGTGCRIGEALALRPINVNMRTGKVRFISTISLDKDGTVTIGPPKTEASDREIAVPRSILNRLDLSREYVFTTPEGAMLSPNSFRTGPWYRAVRKAGLPPHRIPRIHDLRHTHASRLLEAGISLHAVQQRLGHSNVMTTLRIYGHAATDSEARILSALE